MKKRRRKPAARRAPFDPLDVLEETSRGCQNIETLARLLACCPPDSLGAKTSARVGALIFHESKRLQAQCEWLHRQWAKAKGLG